MSSGMEDGIRRLALLTNLILFTILAAPAHSGDAPNVFRELGFTRLVYSHETQPDLVAGALRYANERESFPIHLRLERAERQLQAGRAASSIRNFEILARYGDKYAQYQIGRIFTYGLGSQPPNPAEGLAWLALASEHPKVRAEIEVEIRRIWQGMSDSERTRARQRVTELAAEYSNLAVLDKVHDYLGRRLRTKTGSRLANARGPMVASSEGVYEIYKVAQEHQAVEMLLDTVGNVELGELVVLEPAGQRVDSRDDRQ